MTIAILRVLLSDIGFRMQIFTGFDQLSLQVAGVLLIYFCKPLQHIEGRLACNWQRFHIKRCSS